MPMDALNPPGQRKAAFREGDSDAGADSGGRVERDGALKIESMLLEEFNYASTTAYQAMEDRARMFNMYLLVVGILGSAFGAIYPLGGGARNFIQPIAAVVLFAAGETARDSRSRRHAGPCSRRRARADAASRNATARTRSA